MLQSVLWIQSFCQCPSVCQFYLIAQLNKVEPTPTTWPNMVKCVVPTWHIMDTEKCLSDQNSAEPVAHKVQFVPKSQISETDTAVNMVNGRIPSPIGDKFHVANSAQSSPLQGRCLSPLLGHGSVVTPPQSTKTKLKEICQLAMELTYIVLCRWRTRHIMIHFDNYYCHTFPISLQLWW